MLGTTRCPDHLPHHARRFKSGMYQFKSPQLQQTFEMMLKADDRYTLDNELALMRVCLDGVISSCQATESKELSAHAIAAITSLSSEIGKMCDVVARLEQRTKGMIPTEVLLFFIQLIADELSKKVEPDLAESVVSAILEMPLPQDMSGFRRDHVSLGRQPIEPMQNDNSGVGIGNSSAAARESLTSDAREKIAELRAQAKALRDEIAKSDPGFERDEDLAPAEPTEDTE
jgi:hypothetical protein